MLTLNEEQTKKLQAQVDAGQFATLEEALDAAIARFDQEVEEVGPEIREVLLRRSEALAQGQGLAFNSIEDLEAHFEKRLRERAQNKVSI